MRRPDHVSFFMFFLFFMSDFASLSLNVEIFLLHILLSYHMIYNREKSRPIVRVGFWLLLEHWSTIKCPCHHISFTRHDVEWQGRGRRDNYCSAQFATCRRRGDKASIAFYGSILGNSIIE